jgi:hypothetical protein
LVDGNVALGFPERWYLVAEVLVGPKFREIVFFLKEFCAIMLPSAGGGFKNRNFEGFFLRERGAKNPIVDGGS